jgi:class 3 adenylate cyclase
VLFVDLVGSTELSARLDPEDLASVIRAYQECCAQVIGRWSGHIAKYMGDGVLAYFGWPKAHEDQAERAVRAGLEVVNGVATLETSTGTALAARAGIATGLVMVGELIGEGAAQEQAVVGDAQPRSAAAGARQAGQRGHQPGDAPAGRRAVRADRPRPAASQRLRRAAVGLAGRG